MSTTNNSDTDTNNQVSAGMLDKVDLSNEYIYDQALKITQTAQDMGVVLRLIGATAFINHCPTHNHLYDEASRKLTDVDLMAYSKTPLDKLDAVFKSVGYEPIRALSWHSTTRDIYVNNEKLYIDVFRDILAYCHPISFIDRLELDFPTIPLVDLLLQKVQIVEINQKDLFDIVVLLLEHDLGNSKEREEIDVKRITGIWSQDWGFYYTGTTNLRKAQNFTGEMPGLSGTEKDLVKEKIETLLKRVEETPKSVGWKLRSKIGTKVRWYEAVEDVER